MLADNLRVAVFIAYVVLAVSRFRAGTTGDAWLLLIAALGANAMIAAGEELYWRRRLRRYVQTLRALDPLHRARVIQNKWQSDVRRLLTQQLAAEGEPDIGGIVERYPFSRRDRQRNTVAYWTVVAAAAVTVAWPLLDSSAPTLMRASSLGLAVLLAATLPFLRRRERRLATVVEISPFAITEVDEGGTGRRLTWTQVLELRNNSRHHRMELAPVGQRDFIAIDYARLGFVRLVARVLDYGGFREPTGPQDPSEAATALAENPVLVGEAPSLPATNGGARVASHSPWRGPSGAVTNTVQIVGAATLLVLAGTAWERRAPREHHYAALTPAAVPAAPVRIAYTSRLSGRGWTSAGEESVVAVSACSFARPGWCVVETRFADGRVRSVDSVVMTRDRFDPVYAALHDVGAVTRSRYGGDSVRSEYRVGGAGTGAVLANRRATVPTRPGAIARPVALDVLLPVARFPRSGRVAIPLQPLERRRPDVARRFPDEDREIESLLQADTAVAWYVGRGSGWITLEASGRRPGGMYAYQADRITVRLPDRAVTYWIADSLGVVVKRETHFRSGPTSTVVEEAGSLLMVDEGIRIDGSRGAASATDGNSPSTQ